MTALVLAGGAARGAWEAGVALHLLRRVGPEVGRPLPIDVLSGTSVGAFHAAVIAAHADDPRAAADRLEASWRGLDLEEALRIDRRGLAALVRGLVGKAGLLGRGSILDPRVFARLATALPFDRIDAHLLAGRLRAVTVSATHVGSGRTTIFCAGTRLEGFERDPTMWVVPVDLRAPHVLASSAIPLLFPPVSVAGELYCDGGVRQLVPLRPALRLGARSLVVVSPRALPVPTAPAAAAARERATASPIYFVGKVLDALFLDHIEGDVERLEQMNQVLEIGRRRFGPRFAMELAAAGQPLHTIATAVVRPSADLGRLAADRVRSRRFGRLAWRPAGRLLRALAEAEGSAETDLVSYLLFDGAHAAELLALGLADAAARHDELCALIAGDARAALAS